jgi:hypothetical protein
VENKKGACMGTFGGGNSLMMDPYAYDVSKGGSHPSPYFTYGQVYSPKRLKELFRWCEFLFYNSAQIYAALRKFGEYPITEFLYETTNQALKSKHKFLIENVIRGRELLIKATLDKYVYGNCFLSLYQPFIRFLRCPHCGVLTNIQNIKYKYAVKKLTFSYKCMACKMNVIAGEKDVEDRKILVSKRLNFIRWDPKLMDIDYNRMTGESVYYYTIPREDIQKVNNGHKTQIDSMPLAFLKAIKDEKQFRFAPDALFHMKVGGPAGINPQWGLPPLLAALQLFHYAQILKKANECVSLEALMEMSTGLVKADDVNVGDLVRTHTGSWQEITDKKYRDAREDEVGVRITVASARGLGQVYSPKHPIMVIKSIKEDVPLADADSKRYSRGKQPPGRILEHPHLYEEACCPAEQIQVGDYALTPRKLPTEEQTVDVAKYTGLVATDSYVYAMCTEETAEAFEKVERGEYVEHNSAGRVAKRTFKAGKELKRLSAKVPMTPDFAYILGWYSGDGACNQRNVGFSLGMDDDAEPLKKAIKAVFGVEPCSNINKQGNLNTITIGNVIVRKLIKGMIPGTSRHKQAPIEVLNGPDTVKLAYLRGLWGADGFIRDEETQTTLATSSLNQAYDAYRMLLHLGCIANLATRETNDSIITEADSSRVIPGGTHYQVRVSGESTRRFLALCRGETPNEVFTGKSGFFWKDYFAIRVAEIAEVEEEQYVDFNVKNDETFVSAGICSHNSIALDYLVPLRVLHPAQSSNNADPLTTISLERWMAEMQTHFKMQRKDPLHIMFAPVPVGVTQIGGNGRALLTLGEQQEAERNIIAALGVPQEFLYGGMTKSGMEATLRLIENQLQTHINDLKDLLQWVDDSCAKFLGWERIRVDMADFTMLDDNTKKQMVMNLFMAGQQQGAPIISQTTMAELYDIDLNKEANRIKQEALDAIRRQNEIQKEVTKIQNNVAQQAQQQAQQGPQQYNQQQVIAQADQIVQQLGMMDPSMKRSQLHALETEDYVLYSVVVQRLEQSNLSTKAQATSGLTG